MLTPYQQKEITDYLLYKRLPYDLASEIFDHMVNQINDLQNEGFSFDEAWDKTKTAWLSELKTTYNAVFSLDDIAIITKRIVVERNKSLLPKIVFYGLLLTVLTFAIIALTSFENMRIVQVSFFIFVVLMMGKSFYESRVYNKFYKEQNKYGNWLTFYQTWVGTPLAMVGLLFMFTNIEYWEALKTSIDRLFSDVSTLSSRNIASLVGATILYTFFYFGCVMGVYGAYMGKKSLQRALNFKEKINQLNLETSK